ncbi:glycosyltransferase family 9 protein [Segetibacter aerophilus]|uniref:Glycosyl hydrolase n=1 Tax=Segetibacter aerophilus TaxID=670293 RepID=A0A512B8D8_9BACT|nr:glycosyltransferase family 9 protein [Segetibacter aerophilus]GEO08226.1 glycosyl hydrolase [Segetibacter aerophilus]
MKFLIIRFSSIGDIVLTTPVIRGLKLQVEGAEVHYLTKNSFKGIVESNPYIDKVHVLEEDFDGMINKLSKEAFDHIIDLHHNLRTLKVKKALSKVPAFSFNKLNIKKWLLTALKINLLPPIHIVDRYLEAVESFGVKNDGKGLDYFIPVQDKVPDHDIPAAQSLGYTGIVIGAAHNTKKLPLYKLKELCTKINHPIVLLGGPEDRAIGDEIASIDPIKIYNSCGKFNLNESADLVRRAKVIVTHDTGLMHIAAAFKKPIISVWGNTVPAFGMTPYFGNTNVEHVLFEIKKLWCRPCSKIGYSKCPLGHFKCMEKHNMSEVAVKAEGKF